MTNRMPEEATSDMQYVYRVVNEDGSFAKPRNKGYGAGPLGPGEARWSTAKGLYTTEGRAKAAIKGGVGKYVERGEVINWERL